jgi:hypothetical protein
MILPTPATNAGAESRQGVMDLFNAGAVAYIRKGITGAHISRILTQALSVHGAGAGA